MRPIIMSLVLATPLLLSPTAIAQPGEDGPPDREHLRERLSAELERLRDRERWLLARLEDVDDETVEIDEQLRDRDQRGPGGRPPEDQPTESVIDTDKLISLLRDIHANDPKLEGDSPFRRILDRDTEERRRLLRHMAPKLRELAQLRESDPVKYEIRRDEMIAGMGIARAARRLGELMHDENADESSIEEARQSLRAAISRGFDAKASVARHELGEVREKLNSLSEEIESAESERSERIDRQYTAMLKRIEEHAPPSEGEPRRGSRGKTKPSRDD